MKDRRLETQAHFRCHLVRILTCKQEAAGIAIKFVQVLVEGVQAKGIDLVETTCVDNYFINTVIGIFFQHIYQLHGRASIEVAR